MKKNKVYITRGDLSNSELNRIISQDEYISIDTETTGLNSEKANIKLIQIASNDEFYLIRMDRRKSYPNLESLLSNSGVIKIFHNAIFDLRFLTKDFPEVRFEKIICTKISEKILNESRENTSLKILVEKYKHIELDKTERLSNWGAVSYSKNQIRYAVEDVKHLKAIWLKQRAKLLSQNKFNLAVKCFDFLTTQIELERLNLENVFKY